MQLAGGDRTALGSGAELSTVASTLALPGAARGKARDGLVGAAGSFLGACLQQAGDTWVRVTEGVSNMVQEDKYHEQREEEGDQVCLLQAETIHKDVAFVKQIMAETSAVTAAPEAFQKIFSREFLDIVASGEACCKGWFELIEDSAMLGLATKDISPKALGGLCTRIDDMRRREFTLPVKNFDTVKVTMWVVQRATGRSASCAPHSGTNHKFASSLPDDPFGAASLLSQYGSQFAHMPVLTLMLMLTGCSTV